MRRWLWIALLLALFALAWRIESRWSDRNRAAQDEAYGRPVSGAEDADGFSRVVIGAPSGAPATTIEASPAPGAVRAQDSGAKGAGAQDEGPRAAPAAGAARSSMRVVRAGETLSQICEEVYGSARGGVVEAVAQLNGLTRPQALRAGQKLVLPPREALTIPTR